MGLDHRRLHEPPAGWDALAAAQSPLADAAWIRCLASAFGEQPQLFTQWEDGQLVAGLAVTRRDGVVRRWTSLDNEHAPYWLLAGTPRDPRAFLEHVLADAEYLYLRRLPVESPACRALRAAADDAGMPVSLIESDAGDARLDITGSWEELRARLPKNFQRDLPRKQRQLAKQGALALVIHTAPGAALDAALVESFAVETRGWKGSEGSPIQRDPRTLRFYTELAQALAASGRFALYTLVLDGKIIAFEYCLRGGGHIEMLKLSFDPAFEKTSPGQVLRMMLLEHEAARGEVRYYHLGRPSEWKRRWATEIAPLCTLRIYARTPRGRAAYLAGPVLRDRLKRSPLAIRIRDRLRA